MLGCYGLGKENGEFKAAELPDRIRSVVLMAAQAVRIAFRFRWFGWAGPALAAAPAGCAPSTPSPAAHAAATPDCAALIATSSDVPPRPFPTFRQTACLQQPPRRRITRCPNVPPALPQQVKRAQLGRRIPAIDQLNPRRNGPIAVADQMLRMLRPQLPGPVNHFGPGTKSTQRRSRSGIADYLQFSTSATGSHTQTVHFQRSARRQLRHGQRRLPQPLADGTLDSAHPVSGVSVAQSGARPG